jgi:hypothetical protein
VATHYIVIRGEGVDKSFHPAILLQTAEVVFLGKGR